ncbi:hypothetical protein A0J61_05069 [Choanephora cucurbitarum]|uniref:Uncharacterized protein n=1 Tax=Choanephora cucurbitarum TaxID=101091 RepID=A0A1C7NHQ8_9FUNG|nr:hypothetical protein A0J61_05069 [Choanephora cucurbitarum]
MLNQPDMKRIPPSIIFSVVDDGIFTRIQEMTIRSKGRRELLNWIIALFTLVRPLQTFNITMLSPSIIIIPEGKSQ